MKKIFTIIIVGVILFGGYMLLNNNYDEAVNMCIEKGNSITYCEYHAG